MNQVEIPINPQMNQGFNNNRNEEFILNSGYSNIQNTSANNNRQTQNSLEDLKSAIKKLFKQDLQKLEKNDLILKERPLYVDSDKFVDQNIFVEYFTECLKIYGVNNIEFVDKREFYMKINKQNNLYISTGLLEFMYNKLGKLDPQIKQRLQSFMEQIRNSKGDLFDKILLKLRSNYNLQAKSLEFLNNLGPNTLFGIFWIITMLIDWEFIYGFAIVISVLTVVLFIILFLIVRIIKNQSFDVKELTQSIFSVMSGTYSLLAMYNDNASNLDKIIFIALTIESGIIVIYNIIEMDPCVGALLLGSGYIVQWVIGINFYKDINKLIDFLDNKTEHQQIISSLDTNLKQKIQGFNSDDDNLINEFSKEELKQLLDKLKEKEKYLGVNNGLLGNFDTRQANSLQSQQFSKDFQLTLNAIENQNIIPHCVASNMSNYFIYSSTQNNKIKMNISKGMEQILILTQQLFKQQNKERLYNFLISDIIDHELQELYLARISKFEKPELSQKNIHDKALEQAYSILLNEFISLVEDLEKINSLQGKEKLINEKIETKFENYKEAQIQDFEEVEERICKIYFKNDIGYVLKSQPLNIYRGCKIKIEKLNQNEVEEEKQENLKIQKRIETFFTNKKELVRQETYLNDRVIEIKTLTRHIYFIYDKYERKKVQETKTLDGQLLSRIVYHYDNQQYKEPNHLWRTNYQNGFATDIKIYKSNLNNTLLWQQGAGGKWKGNFPVFQKDQQEYKQNYQGMRAHLNYDGSVIVKFVRKGIKIGEAEKETHYDVYGRKTIEKQYTINCWLKFFSYQAMQKQTKWTYKELQYKNDELPILQEDGKIDSVFENKQEDPIKKLEEEKQPLLKQQSSYQGKYFTQIYQQNYSKIKDISLHKDSEKTNKHSNQKQKIE